MSLRGIGVFLYWEGAVDIVSPLEYLIVVVWWVNLSSKASLTGFTSFRDANTKPSTRADAIMKKAITPPIIFFFLLDLIFLLSVFELLLLEIFFLLLSFAFAEFLLLFLFLVPDLEPGLTALVFV